MKTNKIAYIALAAGLLFQPLGAGTLDEVNAYYHHIDELYEANDLQLMAAGIARNPSFQRLEANLKEWDLPNSAYLKVKILSGVLQEMDKFQSPDENIMKEQRARTTNIAEMLYILLTDSRKVQTSEQIRSTFQKVVEVAKTAITNVLETVNIHVGSKTIYTQSLEQQLSDALIDDHTGKKQKALLDLIGDRVSDNFKTAMKLVGEAKGKNKIIFTPEEIERKERRVQYIKEIEALNAANMRNRAEALENSEKEMALALKQRDEQAKREIEKMQQNALEDAKKLEKIEALNKARELEDQKIMKQYGFTPRELAVWKNLTHYQTHAH